MSRYVAVLDAYVLYPLRSSDVAFEHFHDWEVWYTIRVVIFAEDIPAAYFKEHASDSGIRAALSSYRAWHSITRDATWSTPHALKTEHAKASILKSGRVVFNIKGNDYRLVCKVNYTGQMVEIRWFGSHAEYDTIDAETI